MFHVCVCVCLWKWWWPCDSEFVFLYALSAFASVTRNLHVILRFANACSGCLFISSPAGNMRITTAWGPDETDLGVNELLTDRQRSSMHLN